MKSVQDPNAKEPIDTKLDYRRQTNYTNIGVNVDTIRMKNGKKEEIDLVFPLNHVCAPEVQLERFKMSLEKSESQSAASEP